MALIAGNLSKFKTGGEGIFKESVRRAKTPTDSTRTSRNRGFT